MSNIDHDVCNVAWGWAKVVRPLRALTWPLCRSDEPFLFHVYPDITVVDAERRGSDLCKDQSINPSIQTELSPAVTPSQPGNDNNPTHFGITKLHPRNLGTQRLSKLRPRHSLPGLLSFCLSSTRFPNKASSRNGSSTISGRIPSSKNNDPKMKPPPRPNSPLIDQALCHRSNRDPRCAVKLPDAKMITIARLGA
ncbi:hypothetical protein VNO77_20154 [Canavalia gladiata]|uniref:Uncharacterized protein n=1 Tax=Canavalia gladiata TaxID=3824 RepID=A0AAN9QQA3_CANGL